MDKYYLFSSKCNKELTKEEFQLLLFGQCSITGDINEGWIELIQICNEKDHLKTLEGFKQLGIELDLVKKLDPVKDVRLYNAIKSGPERQAEVEQFKMMYDKNNVGQVLDKMLEHSIAEMEKDSIINEKDAIIKETQENLDFVAKQFEAAVKGAVVDPLVLPEILSLAGIKY